MARPSKNIDKKLLQAGRELIPVMGISGLKIREVSKKAGANTGMFNYHFGTKEKYLERLMIDIYNEFLKDFKLDSERGENSRERLRSALTGAAFFLKANRTLVTALFEEILKGDKKIVEFARKNMTKHVKIIMGLIKQAQREGYIVKTSFFSILPLFIGAVVIPNVAIRVIEKNYIDTFIGAFIPMLKNTVLSDKYIVERIDFAIKGISTGDKNEK